MKKWQRPDLRPWGAIERWKKPEDPFHQTLLARWDEAIHAFVDDKETKDALEDFGKSLFEKYPAGEKVRTMIDSLLSEWNEDENGKTKLENTLHGFAGSAIDRLAKRQHPARKNRQRS